MDVLKKYINLTMGANRGGANEYGKTHHVKVNDFEPNKDGKKEDDLPF